jgi:hypothetical protein
MAGWSVAMTRRRVLIALVVLLIPVALHAVWDQLEATWFAREFSSLADRHEPVSVDFQRFPLATQEQRRAARIYAAAADLARHARADDPLLSRLEIDVERAFLEADPAAALAPRWRQYAEREPALELLDEATPLDFAGFGPAAPDLNQTAWPLDELASINTLRIAMHIARHDASSAASALIASIRLQRTFREEFYMQQPAADLLGTLRLLLRYAPPDGDTLASLQQAFDALPDADSLQSQLRLRRAWLLGIFWPYPPHSDAWALRVRVDRLRNAGETLAFTAMRPWFTRTRRAEIRAYDAAIDVAGRPWPEKMDAARELNERYGVDPRRGPRWVFCCGVTLTPPLMGIRELQTILALAGERLAIRRVAIAALAAERYRRAHAGSAPPSLDALVPAFMPSVPQDPFTGQPLRYRLDADSYAIYSVDSNRTDDGGRLYGFGTGAEALERIRTDRDRSDLGIRVAPR